MDIVGVYPHRCDIFACLAVFGGFVCGGFLVSGCMGVMRGDVVGCSPDMDGCIFPYWKVRVAVFTGAFHWAMGRNVA